MLNVRLDKEMEKKIKDYSEKENLSKTDVVKEALTMYFTKKQIEEQPYILGEELFGVADSGRSDVSTTYKSRLKTKLNEKHSH